MRLFTIAVAFAIALPGLAAAQDISAGKRVTVTSDWHAKNGGPYSPQIVSCKSSSGLCLRDTNMKPNDTAMQKTKHGLQVAFPKFDVIYLFMPKGNGRFYDMSGKQTGKFTWTQ